VLFDREKNLYKYKLKKRFKTYFSDGRERPLEWESSFVFIAVT